MLFVAFPLMLLTFFPLLLIFISLICMFLVMFLFGFILYGLLAFCTWVAISILLLGKFLTIISANVFSYLFFFSSFSEIPIIQMLVPLMLSSFLFIPLNFGVCSPLVGLDRYLVKASWLGETQVCVSISGRTV